MGWHLTFNQTLPKLPKIRHILFETQCRLQSLGIVMICCLSASACRLTVWIWAQRSAHVSSTNLLVIYAATCDDILCCNDVAVCDWFHGLTDHLTFYSAQRLDLFAWCVRLSRLLVGFRTHFKSLHFLLLLLWHASSKTCINIQFKFIFQTFHMFGTINFNYFMRTRKLRLIFK